MSNFTVSTPIDTFMQSANQQAMVNNLGLSGLTTSAGVLQTGVFAGAGVASTPALKLNGAWFSGGSGTTTKPQFLIEPVGATTTNWNTSGTGLGINAPSGFAGFLSDFQLDGDSCLSIKYSANGPQIKAASGLGIIQWFNSTECFLTSSNGGAAGSAGGFRMASDVWLGWSSGAANAADQDTSFQRIAAGRCGLKSNAGTQQIFEVYESAAVKFTSLTHDGTNAIWSVSSGVCSIASGVVFRLGIAPTTGLVAGVLAALTTASLTVQVPNGDTYQIPALKV